MIAFPPYISFDALGEPHGLDVDILRRTMALAGCDFTLREVPFKRALRDVKLGHLDGMPSVSRTPEREDSNFFSQAMRQEVVGGFARAGNTEIHSISSFDALVTSDLKVGVVLGGWYGPAFTNAMANNPAFHARVQTSSDFLTLFRWLEAGIVDVAIVDMLSGYHVSKQAGFNDRIEALSFSVNVNDLHLMLSRATVSDADLKAIDAALAAFKRSPDYRALLRLYGPDKLMGPPHEEP
jgi:polar amino acid transport system substrate-binding protein